MNLLIRFTAIITMPRVISETKIFDISYMLKSNDRGNNHPVNL